MRLWALLLAAPLCLLGCGGDEDSTKDQTSGLRGVAHSNSDGDLGSAPAAAPRDSGGGAAQFHSEGSDNSIQSFGHEAGGTVRAEAAASLHAFLAAAAQADLPTACSRLATAVKQSNARLLGSELAREGCPAVLEVLWSNVPDRTFDEAAAEADVGSFRVQGRRGFLLYHGPQHIDYQMPMVLEQGQWKVAAISGSPLL